MSIGASDPYSQAEEESAGFIVASLQKLKDKNINETMEEIINEDKTKDEIKGKIKGKDNKYLSEYYNSKTLCDKIAEQGDNQSFENIVESHHDNRTAMLKNLNSIFKQDQNYQYVDLNFVNNFYYLLSVGETCLCENNKNNDLVQVERVLSSGAVGTASIIKIKGIDYVMKSIARVSYNKNGNLLLEIKFIEKNPSLAFNEALVYNLKTFDLENKDKNGIIVAYGDSFATQTCLHMILNEILKNRIPNYVYQYDAFLCESESGSFNGYNITELCDLGDLSSFINKSTTTITDELLYDMVYQLLLPMSFLKCKKFGFNHADLKCRNIFVQTDKSNNEKIIYKIADYDKSSIFWKGIQFCNKPEFGDSFVSIGQAIIKEIVTKLITTGYPIKYEMRNNELVYYYELAYPGIGNKASAAITQIIAMHSHYPMYMTYDIYTFLVSLYYEPKIWEHFAEKKSKLLLDIWNIIWFDNDPGVQKIKDTMQEYYDKYKKQLANVLEADNDAEIEKEKVKAKNIIKELNAILKINSTLLNAKLKYNLDDLFKYFNLPSYNDLNKHIDAWKMESKENKELKYLLSYDADTKSYNICLDECQNNKCKTNRYLNKSRISMNEGSC